MGQFDRPEPLEPPSRIGGALALTVGAVVLVGWTFDVAVLKSVVPGWTSMKLNTALAFVAIGLALWVRSPRLARACALAAGTLGVLTLSQYFFGWDLGIDQWLIREPPGAVGTSHPGRMAPDTALCFASMAGAAWLARSPHATKQTWVASAMLGAMVTLLGLIALLAVLGPGLYLHGWWGFTHMAAPTAGVFAVLGGATLLGAWRKALGPGLVEFSSHLWRTACCLAVLAVAFALYARSEAEILRAHELRHRSFLLADELRQSGDDLTRMVRTYVVTGEPKYKRHFQDILDIRDGKKPRPAEYWKPYWDLTLGDGPGPGGTERAVPLLELMRQAGFTEEEFQKLAEAKANSDGLTIPEFEAMRLIESSGPDAEADRARARAMLYDAEYHQAKRAVMGPIRDFLGLVDARTARAVRAAENSATFFRYAFAASALALVLVLWRAYVALHSVLGGAVDDVHMRIAAIGGGDFSAPVVAGAGLENSVLGWLGVTQVKLAGAERERGHAEAEVRQLAATLEARVAERTAELEQVNAHLRAERALTDAIRRAQTRFIVADSSQGVFDDLLESLLELSESEYGFIDELFHTPEGAPYLAARAITDISWNEQTRRMYAEFVSGELTFTKQESLFGAVMTSGKPVIANDAPNDPRRGGVPPGHPALRSFLGLPLHAGEKLVGVIGLANRPGGYSADVVGYLDPVVRACANLLSAWRGERQRAAAEAELSQRTVQLEAANKELESFSYSVSHDLRTPLRAIDGYSRMLLEDYEHRLDPEGQRLLGVVSRETQRMGQLIDDLLAFSRLGRHKLEMARIDMTELARSVFEEVAAHAPNRALKLDLEPLLPAHGDRTVLRLVWSNLLSNAIKFSAHRDPALIEIASERTEGESVYSVRDHGVGFDMKYANKLFGVFQRLHSSAEFEGTGVGLALVQRIIHRHGGRVWADAKAGEGATFSFSLPEVKEAA